MARRALITGGTGFVGSHTVEHYLTAGWRVRVLLRDPNRLVWLDGLDVEHIVGTLVDPGSLRKAVRDCDVVVHCAGLTKAVRREDFFRVNAEAVADFVEAARDAGVKRFVYCSSQAAAGPSPGDRPRVEEDKPQPVTAYGESKLEGEREVRSRAGRMQWVTLRPSAIIGPRDWQFLPLFRGVARLGLYPQFGGGRQVYSFISGQDTARALLLAGEAETHVNEVYFVCHPEPADWFEASQMIAEMAGRRVRRIVLPAGALKIAGALADAAAKLTGRPALLGRDKAREILLPGWTCSPAKIERNWGFRCEYGLHRTLRETFDFYRQGGHL